MELSNYGMSRERGYLSHYEIDTITLPSQFDPIVQAAGNLSALLTTGRVRHWLDALPDPQAQPIAFLREAIRQRRTILVSGGTSTGKTTFLNAMLGEIPGHERVVLVEDTPELKLPGENGVGLVAVKGELGEAKVTANELLQAALRLRPDRIVLGELRGAESVSFLRAIKGAKPLPKLSLHVFFVHFGLCHVR